MRHRIITPMPEPKIFRPVLLAWMGECIKKILKYMSLRRRRAFAN